VLKMGLIAEIRRHHFVQGESISVIARALKLFRPTVRKHLTTQDEPVYQHQRQPAPKLGAFQAWLETESQLPKSRRNGSLDAYKSKDRDNGQQSDDGSIPLTFDQLSIDFCQSLHPVLDNISIIEMSPLCWIKIIK